MTEKYPANKTLINLMRQAVTELEAAQRDPEPVRKKKSKERRRDAMQEHIVQEILSSLKKDTYQGKRDYLVLTLLWALGVRINELSTFTYRN